jgi:dolichol-phosphate mannosyltransferase
MNSRRNDTLITLATYNEIENLPLLVEEILRVAPQADLLVIDDNSPDGTGDWCDQKGAEEPRLRCLHRAGKLGLGTATIAGIRQAIDEGYTYVLNLDADFSHPPRYIPALLEAMYQPVDGRTVDVAIGSRYVSGGAIEGWPLRRHLMSRAVNGYARWLLSLKPRDCSGAFRCYRVSKLREIDLAAVRSRGYSFQEEMLWHLERAGATMREVPITFVDRQRGSSKIDLREACGTLAVILNLAAKNVCRRSPAHRAGT